MHLRHLAPNQTYAISVRAFCDHAACQWMFTDSDHVTITTYPEPKNISLLQISSTVLMVGWEGTNRYLTTINL